MSASERLNELMRITASYDIVSFDVFDTLLVRQVPNPQDVFEILEAVANAEGILISNLQRLRIEAEKKAELLFTTPTLDEIYDLLGKETNINEEQLNRLKLIEIQVEKDLLLPRKDVKELFNSLLQKGKRVLLISDMYLSSSVIKELLSSSGFDISNYEIYVSCEERKTKASGKLWAYLTNKIKTNTWLHLGDDTIGDVRYPRKYGIQVLPETFKIKSPKTLFIENEILNKRLGKYINGSISEKLFLGKLISQYLFNNAFSLIKSSDEDISIVGAWLGPLLSEFIEFISQNGKRKHLLFVTREGYTLKPLYEKYCITSGIKPETNSLFFASRVSTSLANSISFVRFSLLAETPFEGTIEEFLKSKLELSLASGKVTRKLYKLPREKKEFLSEIRPLYPEIYNLAILQNSLYKKYLENVTLGIEPCVVDIGFSGRTQYNLSQIYGKKVSGLYLMLDRYSLLGGVSCPEEHLHPIPNPIYENLPYFEGALQVRKQSTIRLFRNKDSEILPIFAHEKLVSSIVPEACHFAEDFVTFTGCWKKILKNKFELQNTMGIDIWIALLEANFLPDKYLKNLTLEDKFSGLNTIRVYELKKNYKHNFGSIKYWLKNEIKKRIPLFAYNFARDIWIRHFK